MEFSTIEREIHVEATPEVVYEVISTPEHLRGWWPDEAEFEPKPGATGRLTFGDSSSPDAHIAPITVVEMDPPRRFAFRWCYEDGQTPATGTSLLVTFDLVPSGAGTLVRMTETGFREMGWDATVLEATYNDHSNGWNHFMPRLAPYVAGVVSAP